MIKRITILLSVIIAILIGGFFVLRSMHASIGYEFKAQFETLPQNDEGLEKWFLSQPGVVKAFVNREKDEITGYIVMVQRIAPREPSLPKVQDVFDNFGYKRNVSFKWR